MVTLSLAGTIKKRTGGNGDNRVVSGLLQVNSFAPSLFHAPDLRDKNSFLPDFFSLFSLFAPVKLLRSIYAACGHIAAARLRISSIGTSSTCVATCQMWPYGSVKVPMRSP